MSVYTMVPLVDRQL